MGTTFDPYHVWLGIPPAEQPPNHYRLLALAPLEDTPEVIENAADRQMAHVRRAASGRHAEQSQRLLNEISAAARCLLDPERKAAYDASLQDEGTSAHRLAQTLDWAPASPPAAPPPVLAAEMPLESPGAKWKGGPPPAASAAAAPLVKTEPSSLARARGKRSAPVGIYVVVATLALLPVLMLLIGLAVVGRSSIASSDEESGNQTADRPSDRRPDISPLPSQPETDTSGATPAPLPKPDQPGDVLPPPPADVAKPPPPRVGPSPPDNRDPFDETPSFGRTSGAPVLSKTLTVSARSTLPQLAFFNLPAHAATGVQLKAGQIVKMHVEGQWRVGRRGGDLRGPSAMWIVVGQTGRPATQFRKAAAEVEFTVEKSGQLFLGIDDWLPADNAGDLTVQLEVY